MSPEKEYSIEYQTFRVASASPLVFGVNSNEDELPVKAFRPAWRICHENLTGLNLIWAGKVKNFVFMDSALAEELASIFVPTWIPFEGLRLILGICGLKDLSAEKIRLWLGLPTLTIATGWFGGYKLQHPTWPLEMRPKVRSRLKPFGYTKHLGELFDWLPKTRLTDPLEPLIKVAFETHRFNWLESLIAPIVVFTELKAVGQLGAEAQLAVDSKRVARISIQGAYKVQEILLKVMNK